jgi:hypothetical protein
MCTEIEYKWVADNTSPRKLESMAGPGGETLVKMGGVWLDYYDTYDTEAEARTVCIQRLKKYIQRSQKELDELEGI